MLSPHLRPPRPLLLSPHRALPLKNEQWVDLQDPSRKGPLRNPESVGDVVAFRDLQFDLDDPPRKDPLRDPADPEPEGGVATRDLGSVKNGRSASCRRDNNSDSNQQPGSRCMASGARHDPRGGSNNVQERRQVKTFKQDSFMELKTGQQW